jgi:hypothetical protein
MSYARFGWDGSGVYVFKSVGNDEHPGGWLECCGCVLPSSPEDWFQAFSTAAMVDHLRAHVAAGQHVPGDLVPALLADDAENFPPPSPDLRPAP